MEEPAGVAYVHDGGRDDEACLAPDPLERKVRKQMKCDVIGGRLVGDTAVHVRLVTSRLICTEHRLGIRERYVSVEDYLPAGTFATLYCGRQCILLPEYVPAVLIAGFFLSFMCLTCIPVVRTGVRDTGAQGSECTTAVSPSSQQPPDEPYILLCPRLNAVLYPAQSQLSQAAEQTLR